MSAPRTVVVVGAGAVGRGFVGEVFHDAGWLVSFVDVNDDLLARMRDQGGYQHVTVGPALLSRQIGPVRTGRVDDAAYLATEVQTASCIATSVGQAALPAVAAALRQALLSRYRAGGGPVDILLCENLHQASVRFRELLLDGLDPDAARLLDEQTGLVETSIGRMIPLPEPGADPSEVRAEPYRFLPVDLAAMKAPCPDVLDLVGDPDLDFAGYGDRKLYVHNLGHYLCGLLGQRAGCTTIPQAVADLGIRYLVRAAMLESAVALSLRYQLGLPGLVEHVDDLLHRFANQALGDTVARVVRDPRRKMAPDDRVLGAYRTAREAGAPVRYLSLAVAAGALALERDGAGPAEDLVDATTAGSPLARALLAELRTGQGTDRLLALVDQSFDPPQIP